MGPDDSRNFVLGAPLLGNIRSERNTDTLQLLRVRNDISVSQDSGPKERRGEGIKICESTRGNVGWWRKEGGKNTSAGLERKYYSPADSVHAQEYPEDLSTVTRQ